VSHILAASLVGLSLLGAVHVGPSSASAALKTYTDKAHHVSFQYPATWTKQVGSLDDVAMALGAASRVSVTSPDGRAAFVLLVKASSTNVSKMKAGVTALLKDGDTIIGEIQLSTSKNPNGLPVVSGSALVKFDATHGGDVAMEAVSNDEFTFYEGEAEQTKPAVVTTQDDHALTAIYNSGKVD
jgi:hypothetical protein